MTRLVHSPIPPADVRRLAEESFGDFVKAVVDVRRRCMAVGGELHADQEALLLQEGSTQGDLWGINIYPGLPAESMVEFDSIINIRPAQGNRSRAVEDPQMRDTILSVVRSLLAG
jgi:hypothetical protein